MRKQLLLSLIAVFGLIVPAAADHKISVPRSFSGGSMLANKIIVKRKGSNAHLEGRAQMKSAAKPEIKFQYRSLSGGSGLAPTQS